MNKRKGKEEERKRKRKAQEESGTQIRKENIISKKGEGVRRL